MKTQRTCLFIVVLCLSLQAHASPFLTADSYPPSAGILSFQIYLDRNPSPIVVNAATDSIGNQVLVYDLASLAKTAHTAYVTATAAGGPSTPSSSASFNLATATPTYDYLIPPTSGEILIGNDTWQFGSVNQNGKDYSILLDGAVAGGGYAVLLINEGGTIEVVNSSNQWWKWNGSGWSSIAAPAPYLTSDFSAANVSGILNDYGGEGANAWTWGSANGGQYQILRDSVQAGGGYGKLLIHQGDFIIYAEASSGWWQWNGQNATSWTSVSKPPAFP